MQFHRLAPAGLAALVAASSLGAQSTGTVEIGGFGQYSQLDEGDGGINIKNPVGFGFRIGGFMTPRLQLEIDGSYGTGDEDDVPSGRSALEVGVSTLAARLNYNFPFGTTGASSFILGAGAVRTNIKVDTDDDPNTIGGAFGDEGPFSWNYGVSGLAGFRYGFTPTFALRVDAIGEYLPDPSTFNITGRAGLSYMFNAAAPTTDAMGSAMGPGVGDGIQAPGAIELGGFLMFPILASDWNLANGIGGGARAGFFVTPRWQIEGDGSYAALDVDDENANGAGERPLGDDSYNYSTFAARLNYNIPFGTQTSFVVGAGPTLSAYEYTYNYGASGLAGFRFGFTPQVAFRGDVVANYLPEPSAFDIQLRAGISYFVGGAPAAEPTVVATPEPTPVDTTPVAPVTPVDTTPAAPVDTTPVAPAVDSTAMRVEAARNALLARIYFDFDRSDLTDSARATLDAKLPVLQANPNMRIRITGHTDARGSDEYNLALGQRRAAAARRYLVSRGIAANRFETVSRGEEQPAVPNATTEDEHAQNRRNEFEIIIGGDNITPPEN